MAAVTATYDINRETMNLFKVHLAVCNYGIDYVGKHFDLGIQAVTSVDTRGFA